ncbi:MAG: hypothetical protein IKK34_00765 [Clostridia bacterium]|nr:hypothetical protein [Clostridia bacterium]
MRILALPAAALLAAFLYPVLPGTAARIHPALDRLYAHVLRAFTRKSGKTDEDPALWTFILLLSGVAALLAAVHPLAEALLIAPLMTGFSVFPGCASVKKDLDSGKYARDIPAYEACVRKACASITPAFVSGICAPMIFCAAGMPLHLGAALGWALLALRSRQAVHPLAQRICARADRFCDAVFCAFLILCSGVCGRSPFRTRGRGAQERMMNILGIAGNGSDTHAPMAGDISQAAFLCCFAFALLLITLTLIGFVLC